MRSYQVFVCDKCGKESRVQEEIEVCEAEHMGLNTMDIKHEYDDLKSIERYCLFVLTNTKNEQTQKAYDEALHKLMEFEKRYNIQDY